VAASGWRSWPPRLPDQPIFYPVLNRWYATKIAREWNVPSRGVGYVTRFEVTRSHLERYEVHQVGGRDVLEYWIPAEDLDEFNRHIVGTIVEEAEYRGPVDDVEFAEAAAALSPTLPEEWRAYLQARSWFRRGWLDESETYVWLYTPREMLEIHKARADTLATHPEIAIIGGDGTRKRLALDLRQDPAPVLLVDIGSGDWDGAIPQASTVADLVRQIEARTFRFRFSGD
jgi:hypothetical protein